MLKTFALIFTVWNADGTPPGVYVMDYDMTGEDCISALITRNNEAQLMGAIASCEIEDN